MISHLSKYKGSYLRTMETEKEINDDPIPSTEDKKMVIEYNDIQFKDSLKLINNGLNKL